MSWCEREVKKTLDTVTFLGIRDFLYVVHAAAQTFQPPGVILDLTELVNTGRFIVNNRMESGLEM